MKKPWEQNVQEKQETYTEENKKLWVYLSNVELIGGAQEWKPQHDSWQKTVNLALGYMS